MRWPRVTIRWMMALAASVAVVFGAIRSEWGLVPLAVLTPLCAAVVQQRLRGRKSVTLGLLILGGLAAFIAPNVWHWEGHGLAIPVMESLRYGSTRAEVIQLAGRPSSITRSEGGAETWYYSRWTWCMIQVSFWPDGTVAHVEHDH